MTKPAQRDILFRILLDNEAAGLTVIRGAPIHSSDDFLRARAELARATSGAGLVPDASGEIPDKRA